MKKAIVFDMDGVIVDSEMVYIERLLNFLESLGYKSSVEQLSELVGADNNVEWELMREIIKNKLTQTQFEAKNKEYFKNKPMEYNKVLFQDIKPLLVFLKSKKIPVGLASNSPPESIEWALENCDIKEYFDVISSGHDFLVAKPDPTIYIKTFENLGISPNEGLVVEDSTHGITAARAAGVGVVIARKDERFGFDQSGADKIVISLDIVKEYFA